MRHFFKRLNQHRVKAFTLVEMLIVLLIVSVLLLLFVPNLSKQKETIEASSGRALVKVIESQAELYELSHDGEASLSALVQGEFISQEQADKYLTYVAQNNVAQTIPN